VGLGTVLDTLIQKRQARRRDKRHRELAQESWPLVCAVPGGPSADTSPSASGRESWLKPAAAGGCVLLASTAILGAAFWVQRASTQTEVAPNHLDGSQAAEQVRWAEPELVTPDLLLSSERDAGRSRRVSSLSPGDAQNQSSLPPKMRAAVLLSKVDPVYPNNAHELGIEGLVVVTYTVDAGGQPQNLQITKSVPMLDDAVLSAIRQWKYTQFGDTTQKYRFSAEFTLH